jgi:HTH-type transcriptional repressor of NAD biosynthesis genes
MKIGFYAGRFHPFHQGHLFSVLYASNAVDRLYVILTSSENRDRKEAETAGIKYACGETRLSWIGKTLRHTPNVHIAHIADDSHSASDYDWKKGGEAIRRIIQEPIHTVFGSEPSYASYFKTLYPTAEYHIIDEQRVMVPISGTEIRKNLFKHWEYLPPAVREFYTKKILLTGTESVGKSVLTAKLAGYFNTNFVEEVGRTYCNVYSNKLRSELFDQIAMEHYLKQVEALQYSNKVLFVDSDAIATQYYLKMYCGVQSGLIGKIIEAQNYDLIIYLTPDVKWIYDGLRFKGDQKERDALNKAMYSMYEQYAKNFSGVLKTVSGNYQNRFMQSIHLVKELLC